jgi:putative drug exporter of the RND superfamily
VRLGRVSGWCARRAPLVIAAWVVAAVVLAVWAPSLQKVGVQDETSFLPAGAPSQQANQLLQRLFPNDPTLQAGIVVLARPGGLDAGDESYIAGLDRWLTHSPVGSDVKTIESVATDPALVGELRSPDGAAELVVIGFKAAPFTTSTDNAITAIRRHIDGTAPAGLSHHLTGTAGLAADEATGLVRSFTQTAWITVLLVLAILVLVYRSLLAPLVPLASIGLAYLVARGIVGVMAAHGFKVATLAETFMIVMVFGAGTDYCLFAVSRYREHLDAGEEPGVSTIGRTMTVVGTVIAASAITVVAGFLSMLTARFGIYKTMGPAIGIAILVTLAAALTLTPALLSLAGRLVFWPSQLQDPDRNRRSSIRWRRLARWIRRQPAVALLAGLIILLFPANGLALFHESFDLINELPAAADARQGFNVLGAHFPAGTVAPVYVVIDPAAPVTTNDRLAAIDRLTEALRAVPGVQQVRSITQPDGQPLTNDALDHIGGKKILDDFGLDPNKIDVTPLFDAMSRPGGLRFNSALLARYPQLLNGPLSFFVGQGRTSTRVFVALAGNPYSRQALPVIGHLDQTANNALAGTALSGARLEIGGPPAAFTDMQQVGNRDFRVMTAVLLAGIFAVLALLLRSLIAPFYLLATVLVSYAATLGLTSAVFDGLLHQKGLSFWLPPFLFIILVALGADYNIFIMSRVREEADRGHPPLDAVEEGLVATGRVITSAGLILAGTFAALVLAPLPMLAQIGFAVTAGVLIDTFLVRSLIVPAATMLLGRWAFWPAIPNTAARPARPRPAWVAASLGIAALAAALTTLAVGTRTATPITRVSVQPKAPATTTTRTVCGRQCATTAGTAAATAPTARPALTGKVAAASARPATTPGTGTQTSPATATPARTAPATTATAPPATTTPAAPTRITIPAAGAWTYHVTGTRKIGAAGSQESIDENDATQVSQTGGNSQTAQIRLYTKTSTDTEDDTRSYSPTTVNLVATQLSSGGLGYGGTLQPPQQLIAWPAHVGDTWASNWTTGNVNGQSTSKILDTRSATVAGHNYQCWDVHTDTTFTGAAQGQEHQTLCWVPQLGMSVDDTQSFQGSYSGIAFNINTHSTLISGP